MIPRQPTLPHDEPVPMPVEAALDEALANTFPASDPINLHQWTEMQHSEPPEPLPPPEPASPDKAELYLRGPTAYCA
jgi:hypothetical protein